MIGLSRALGQLTDLLVLDGDLAAEKFVLPFQPRSAAARRSLSVVVVALQ
jgi:hypothetical protein